MPNAIATITEEQRVGLYELVRNHLAGIGDVWIALEENGDFATAERLGLEFGEDFRLLADIGWKPSEDREEFELTMPPHDLTEVLRRLHGEAEKLLVESPGEMERIGPPLDPQIERAEEILGDFARFWEVEPRAAERRKLIVSLFDRVWQEDGQIVAVKPREPFIRYFKIADEAAQLRTGVDRGGKGGGGQTRKKPRKPHDHAAGVNSGSDGTRTRDLRRDRPAL